MAALDLDAAALRASGCSAEQLRADFSAPGGREGVAMWLWVKTNGIPFWGPVLVYFSGNWDVH